MNIINCRETKIHQIYDKLIKGDKMNLLLILTIILALIIIILILLYNGIVLSLNLKKIEASLQYEFKVSFLKIPIFKRNNLDKKEEDELEDEDEEEEDENEEDKGLKEKYYEIKPLIKDLKESKQEIKVFLKKLLKSIDIRKIHGNMELGLNDNMKTIKIASWIWSVGAIVNTISEPSQFIVKPIFTEEKIDIDINLEAKINLLSLIIAAIALLTKEEIRKLIKDFRAYRKDHTILIKREEDKKSKTAN